VSGRRWIAAAALALAPASAQAIDVPRVVTPAGIDVWFVEDRSVPAGSYPHLTLPTKRGGEG